MMRHWMKAVLGAAGLLFLGFGSPLKADTFQTFNFTYSGAALGNTAVAVGQINLDETLLPNPGSSFNTPDFVQDLTITVSGAGTGDGTFTKSDFSTFYWDTGGATLNLTQNLVGQPTAGSPWGSFDGSGGDFNFFAVSAPAPYGSYYFTLTTNGGTGDPMQLTSFAPTLTSTPEPGTSVLLILAGSCLLGLGTWRRLRRVSALQS